MSYCRWSSDFGECDVYVYEHVGGWWDVNVAGRRWRHTVPQEIKDMLTSTGDEFVEQYLAERQWRDSVQKAHPHEVIMAKNTKGEDSPMYWPADSEYIDLSTISKHAGAHWQCDSPGEAADVLEMVRDSGLNVPQYAIDTLREEQEDVD